MADLITRLLLETGAFDQNIAKSSKQIQSFQTKIDGFSKGAITQFTKFAGAAGLAFTALDTFNKAMRSNQTTSDMFDNTINAATGSVDLFFKSLVTGDWTVFQNGAIDTYEKLFDLSKMMDDLNDKALSLQFTNAEDIAELAKWREQATDSSLSKEDRNKGVWDFQVLSLTL